MTLSLSYIIYDIHLTLPALVMISPGLMMHAGLIFLVTEKVYIGIILVNQSKIHVEVQFVKREECTKNPVNPIRSLTISETRKVI